MCQGKTAIKNEQPKKTVWVVLYCEREDKEPSGALKVLSSKLRAKLYCEEAGKKWFSDSQKVEGTGYWENDYTYALVKPNGETYCTWVLEETVIDDDVESSFHYPPIEKENEVLRNECYRLRRELAEVTQRNAVAATYATMWDGGRDYTKEHILDNLQSVREVLSGDHRKVRELYENWKKNEECGA